jgi:hypothetical protein
MAPIGSAAAIAVSTESYCLAGARRLHDGCCAGADSATKIVNIHSPPKRDKLPISDTFTQWKIRGTYREPPLTN